jgi:hypothetical protein
VESLHTGSLLACRVVEPWASTADFWGTEAERACSLGNGGLPPCTAKHWKAAARGHHPTAAFFAVVEYDGSDILTMWLDIIADGFQWRRCDSISNLSGF